jgi:hypothetical protein
MATWLQHAMMSVWTPARCAKAPSVMIPWSQPDMSSVWTPARCAKSASAKVAVRRGDGRGHLGVEGLLARRGLGGLGLGRLDARVEVGRERCRERLGHRGVMPRDEAPLALGRARAHAAGRAQL